MRLAHTITDVADLLCDYSVDVLLTDKSTVEFLFPTIEEEREYKQSGKQSSINAIYGNFDHLPKNDPIKFKRKCTYVIRTLVSTPRFWRLTTTADQLSTFCMYFDKIGNKKYGFMKVRKKRDENLQIVFENMKYAKKFMKDLYQTKMFVEAKNLAEN